MHIYSSNNVYATYLIEAVIAATVYNWLTELCVFQLYYVHVINCEN